MKRVFMFCLLLMVVFGAGAQRVSHTFKNESLSKVLSVLGKESQAYQISFLYDKLEDCKVTVSFRNLTIPEAINRVTEFQPVKVKQKKNIITVQYRKKSREKISLHGKVFDSRTHKMLPGATVQLLATDSTVLSVTEASRFWMDGGEQGYTSDFYFDVLRHPRSYLFKVSYVGYCTVYIPYTLNNLSGRKFLYDLPPFYLKEERNTLKEVSVVASKVKFYHKGDTVVYNADAFQLAEGSMLDALIRQLPGAELKEDGRIYLNGRFVETLLLNGKDFFKGNNAVMLENLPSYTVKDIQVYDKRSDNAHFLNIDNDRGKQFVMDVRLKRQYAVGWLANIEGGMGTGNRYLGRLFALRFTDHSQVGVYGNANNLNDTRKPGQNTLWTPSEMKEGKLQEQMAGIDYNVEARDTKWKLNGNAQVAYTGLDVQSNILRTNFLASGNTYDRMKNMRTDHSWSVQTNHHYYQEFSDFNIDLRPSFSYRRFDNRQDYGATTMRDTLLNTYLNEAMSRGHQLEASLYGSSSIKIKDTNDHIELEASANYGDNEQQRLNRYDLSYGQHHYGRTCSNQYFKNHPNRCVKAEGTALYWRNLAHGMSLQTSYTFNYRKENKKQALYLLDRLDTARCKSLSDLPSVTDYERVMDQGNSYDSRLMETRHTLQPMFLWNTKLGKGHVNMQLFLPTFYQHQRLHYQRGSMDTILVRNDFLFSNGNSYLQWDSDDEKTKIFAMYRFEPHTPSLLYGVNIHDDTDPLNIQEGNGNLKTAWSHEVLVSYVCNNSAKQMFQGVEFNFKSRHNHIAMGCLYNDATGVRTYRPYNVNGNWKGQLTYGISVPLGKMKHLALSSMSSVAYANSVDMMATATEETAVPVLSTVHHFSVSGDLRLSYEWKDNKISLFCKPEWQHFDSRHSDFTSIRVTKMNYGATALVKLPWQLELSTDFTVFSRRGYTDSQLNTDDLIWNARLSRTFFKGHIVAMLDTYDMLGELSNISRVINAQGRTETYTNVPPRYAMFHLAYRFNSRPKARK